MITRGHFIGEIVDQLSAISEQVKARNLLGLTDLSVYAEGFAAELLNGVWGTNLKSLNTERANEPGLDLGDLAASMGVQVTSTANSPKLVDTLKAITAEQAANYRIIRVFCLGKKQKSYTISGSSDHHVEFDPARDVWDITDLSRDIVALPLDALQRVHGFMRESAVRLLIDLEMPDPEGNYKTSDYERWEPRPAAKCGDGQAFVNFHTERFRADPPDQKEVAKALRVLSTALSRLPRVTREFLVSLIERRELGASRRRKSSYAIHVSLPKVEREHRGDWKGELRLLQGAGLICVDADDAAELGDPEIFIDLTDCMELHEGFLDFLDHCKLSLRQVVGMADLSAF